MLDPAGSAIISQATSTSHIRTPKAGSKTPEGDCTRTHKGRIGTPGPHLHPQGRIWDPGATLGLTKAGSGTPGPHSDSERQDLGLPGCTRIPQGRIWDPGGHTGTQMGRIWEPRGRTRTHKGRIRDPWAALRPPSRVRAPRERGWPRTGPDGARRPGRAREARRGGRAAVGREQHTWRGVRREHPAAAQGAPHGVRSPASLPEDPGPPIRRRRPRDAGRPMGSPQGSPEAPPTADGRT